MSTKHTNHPPRLGSAEGESRHSTSGECGRAPAERPVAPMSMLRRLAWRLFGPAEPDFIWRLILRQVSAMIAALRACAGQSATAEAQVQDIAAGLHRARAPRSPGGSRITPGEYRNICRSTLAAQHTLAALTTDLHHLASDN